jgi:hypothetical protein
MSLQIAAAALRSASAKPKLSIVSQAVVLQVAQRLEHGRPLHMAAPWDAAVILAGVNVLEMAADGAKAGADILLFDVGVERIK